MISNSSTKSDFWNGAIFNLPGIDLVGANDIPGLPEVVEDGASFQSNAIKKAVTLAMFSRMWTIADDSGLEVDALGGDPGVCLMRRVVDGGGRSRAFINGRSATLQQLRETGEFLVDIHGQHAHQSLLKAAAQRELLDAYAGLERQAKETAAAWKEWQALKKARLEREKNAAAYAEELERLEWQVKELATLNFSVPEWEESQAEHGRLTHAASRPEKRRREVLSVVAPSTPKAVPGPSLTLLPSLNASTTLDPE